MAALPLVVAAAFSDDRPARERAGSARRARAVIDSRWQDDLSIGRADQTGAVVHGRPAGVSVDWVNFAPPVNPEDLTITPDAGLFRWLDVASQPDSFYRDVTSPRSLSTQPSEFVVPLNWWVRFDEAGDYTVRTSTRISTSLKTSGVKVASNPVTFHVAPMAEADEVAEVRRLRALIDAGPAKSRAIAEEACEALLFLTGDAAVRDKVDLFLHPPREIASCIHSRWGLHISRNAELVASLLEQSLKDNAASLKVWNIEDVVTFRIWAEMATLMDTAQGDKSVLRRMKEERSAALRRQYVEDIASRLKDLPPDARRSAALELMKGARGPMPPAVRDMLVEQFETLSPQEQSSLVLSRWQELDAPALVLPVFRQVLARPDQSPENPDRAPALSALLKLSPVEGRSLLIAEILDQRSATMPQTVRLPKPCLLPGNRPSAPEAHRGSRRIS